MKRLFFAALFCCSLNGMAQTHTPLPHGMVFGNKPKDLAPVPATKVEDFMGGKIRVTVALTGKIIKVTKPKGGWFQMDAGNGRIIEGHFQNYNITLPRDLAGRVVIVEGVAQRQLIADDLQHFAGDTVKGAKKHFVKVNPRYRITYIASGLMVDK